MAVKIGLYSITYLGIWYRGGPLALEDVFAKARELGYAGVEIDGKRPHGNPMDLDAKARAEIRSVADAQGLEIPAVAANNDFSSPVPEQLECQLLMVRELIGLARDLGAPVVRLFLAWPGVTYRADGLAHYDIARRRWEEIWRDTTRLEIWESARAAFKEAAAIAEAEGVTLALQNHGPVIRHHQDVIDMVEEVDSPAFQICLDAPLLADQDDVSVRAAVRAAGTRQVHSHFGGEFVRGDDGVLVQRPLHVGQPEVNYAAFADELARGGYRGWTCYEFCHPALNARHEMQGRPYVDEQAALALEYMRSLLPESALTGSPTPSAAS
jgi:sugar phosphate isomerase/epimerase